MHLPTNLANVLMVFIKFSKLFCDYFSSLMTVYVKNNKGHTVHLVAYQTAYIWDNLVVTWKVSNNPLNYGMIKTSTRILRY